MIELCDYYLLLHSLFVIIEQRLLASTIFGHFVCSSMSLAPTNPCTPLKLLLFLSPMYIYAPLLQFYSDLSFVHCLAKSIQLFCRFLYSIPSLSLFKSLVILTEALPCFTPHFIIYYPYSLLFINCFIVLYIKLNLCYSEYTAG